MSAAKTIMDLKPLDSVMSKTYGLVQFIGYFADGLECQVAAWQEVVRPDGTKAKKPINPIVPVSELSLVEG